MTIEALAPEDRLLRKIEAALGLSFVYGETAHYKRASRTDSNAGLLNRANRPQGMYYLSNQTLDTDHGIILEVAVTAGDASDKAPYPGRLER